MMRRVGEKQSLEVRNEGFDVEKIVVYDCMSFVFLFEVYVLG
jgi:hypothetical protein